MKQSPLANSQCRVSFKYSNSPTRTTQTDTLPLLTPSVPLPLALPLAPPPPAVAHIHKLRQSQFSSSKTSKSVIHTDQTLKKEGHSLQAVTLRKEHREETDLMTADAEGQQGNEAAMLREEISYMRRKLTQAQNAEMELRLEFELYRAATEQRIELMQNKSPLSSSPYRGELQQMRNELYQKQQTIHRQQLQLAPLRSQVIAQSQRASILQRSLRQKQQQNKQLTFQTRQMYNQIQMRCADLNAISHDLATLTHDNQLFYTQNNFLREELARQEVNVANMERQLMQEMENHLELVARNNQQDQQIAQLQARVKELQMHRQAMIAEHAHEVSTINEAHQQQMGRHIQKIQEEYGRKLKQVETGMAFTPIEAHSLTTNELQQHLTLLKSQLQQPSSQQYLQICQQLQGLREQLQLMRMTHQQELHQVRDQYQAQMTANNEEYTHQLMIYMKEVDVLMEELAKLKQKKKQSFQEIIQEEEPEEEEEAHNQNGYDDQRIKNDLRLYGEDSSQVFMSTPIKQPSESSEEDTHEFMLNEILEMDSKINSYIANFNRLRQMEEGGEEAVEGSDQ